MEIRDRLRVIMKAAGLSVAEAARKLGMKPNALHNKFHKKTLRLVEAEILAEMSGCSIHFTRKTPAIDGILLHDYTSSFSDESLTFLYTHTLKSFSNGTLYVNCSDIILENQHNQLIVHGNSISVDDNRISIYSDDAPILDIFIDIDNRPTS